MSFPSRPYSLLARAALMLCLVHGEAAFAAKKPSVGRLAAQAAARPAPAAGEAKLALEAVKIRPDVFLISGAGANIVVQIGQQGVLVVDSGSAGAASQVLKIIRSLSDEPIRYVFNTSADPAHVGGNMTLAHAGVAFGQPSALFQAPETAPIAATSAAAQTIQEADYDSGAWPTQTFDDHMSLFLNGQGIEIIAFPGSQSDANAAILFRGSEVLVTGAIFDITQFPLIDVEHGGTIQGEIDALNKLIDMAIPNVPLTWLEGGTTVIPARGRACQQAELVEYRDMVTIVRDRVRDLKNQGKTLQQVIDSNPTAGFAKRYGASAPTSVTGFVSAIYRTLDRSSPQTVGEVGDSGS